MARKTMPANGVLLVIPRTTTFGLVEICITVPSASHQRGRLLVQCRLDSPPGGPRLRVGELPVETSTRQQLFVRAALDDPTPIENENQIDGAQRREAMGDHERRT